MKKIVLLPILLIVACHSKGPSILSEHLQYLLAQKEYFKLDKALQTAARDLPVQQKNYFNAFLDNVFNRNEACVAAVDSLLNAPWPDSIRAGLLLLQGDSYFKLGRYARSATNDSLVVARYSKAVSRGVLDDVMNELLIHTALKTTPPQQTTITANTTIHWTRDKIGLIEIPVTTGGRKADAIFDTRANISSISRSYADRLHLHSIDVSYREDAGITGAEFKTGLGVADSLYIGNILIRNAVFQVMPDSILYIAPIKYQLNLILGLPVIAQLQEIRICKDSTMTIPQTPTPGDLHNFALDGLDPVLALIADNDTLGFDFDTGASSSVLYAAFFSKYKTSILQKAFRKTQTFGGAGGARKKESYVLPSLRLTLDKQPVTIDSITVFNEKISPAEKLYGNIGQDFMRRFDKFTIDFKYMYVDGN